MTAPALSPVAAVGDFDEQDEASEALAITFCDDCEHIATGEIVVLEDAHLCQSCAFTAAAHALAAWRSPYWAPVPSSVKAAQEALRVMRPLLALIEARVQVEAAKGGR
jgi:hypothetical protein